MRQSKLKKYVLIIAITALTGGVAALMESAGGSEQRKEYQLLRKNAGEGDYSARLEVNADGVLDQHTVEVSVAEQRLTTEEVEQLFVDAGKELEAKILGKNESPEKVMFDLDLLATLQEGLVTVAYTFDNYDLVDNDGSILHENVKEKNNLVKVSAQFLYQEQELIHEFYLNIVPRPLNEQETLIQGIAKAIEQENSSKGEEYIILPKQIKGKRLKWYRTADDLPLRILFLGLLICAICYIGEKRKKEQIQKLHRQQLRLDYPDIVGQLSLLVGAGMTVTKAWEKIAMGYQKQRKQGHIRPRPGYEEMLTTLREMQDGVGEIRAYEGFGARCGQAIYRKLASLLMQNVKKGTQGIQQLLDAEANEAFTSRKMLAKELGEEAGTKLLVPMGMMMILVFIILLVPANLTLQI